MNMADSVHSQIIKASGKEEPTIKQCNYLMGLYKDLIRKSILKKHEALQNAKSSDFPFFYNAKTKVGNFALHYLNTFSVQNNLNRGDVSTLISEAKEGNFTKAWIRPFLDSANSYKKAS